jgi:hypothetical protein
MLTVESAIECFEGMFGDAVGRVYFMRRRGRYLSGFPGAGLLPIPMPRI